MAQPLMQQNATAPVGARPASRRSTAHGRTSRLPTPAIAKSRAYQVVVRPPQS
jgi:hypothetical protein